MGNVYLVGFMGAGKTSVGEMLARQMNAGFRDLDRVLSEQFGFSIAEVFARDGEAAFRSAETEALGAIAQQDDLVVATGGGVFANDANRRIIDNSGGISVFLDMPWEELHRRLEGDSEGRPKYESSEQARRLFEERLPHYRRATVTIPLSGAERPDEIVGLIAAEIRGAPCAT